MDNKKRAIMVPVMTLAVCAIAMVGLGFALTTSVTSDLNDVKNLMVDLDSTTTDLGEYDADKVDGLFKYAISTEKKTNIGIDSSTNPIEITYTLTQSKVYLKVFGNYSVDATLKVFSNNTDIQGVVFYLADAEGTITEANKITVGATGQEESEGYSLTVKTNMVYQLIIKSINEIDFGTTGKAVKTYSNGATIEVNTIDSFDLTFVAKKTVLPHTDP